MTRLLSARMKSAKERSRVPPLTVERGGPGQVGAPAMLRPFEGGELSAKWTVHRRRRERPVPHALAVSTERLRGVLVQVVDEPEWVGSFHGHTGLFHLTPRELVQEAGKTGARTDNPRVSDREPERISGPRACFHQGGRRTPGSVQTLPHRCGERRIPSCAQPLLAARARLSWDRIRRTPVWAGSGQRRVGGRRRERDDPADRSSRFDERADSMSRRRPFRLVPHR
jgi:hypothetical protein